MKKTMKKTLSMLFAVIMLLSVMPVAYAAEKSVRETFIEECIKCNTLLNNVYYEWEYEFGFIGPYGDAFRDILRSNNEEEMLFWIDVYKEETRKLETEIANGKLVVIDVHDYIETYVTIFVVTSDPSAIEKSKEISERKPELSEKEIILTQQIRDLLKNGCTQVEFDIAVDNYQNFFNNVFNCINGNHIYGEYISNNDATEEADGTKTATCEFCGATDTVVDEGSKLVKEPASFFERLIALIKAFFEKIFSIFG